MATFTEESARVKTILERKKNVFFNTQIIKITKLHLALHINMKLCSKQYHTLIIMIVVHFFITYY